MPLLIKSWKEFHYVTRVRCLVDVMHICVFDAFRLMTTPHRRCHKNWILIESLLVYSAILLLLLLYVESFLWWYFYITIVSLFSHSLPHSLTHVPYIHEEQQTKKRRRVFREVKNYTSKFFSLCYNCILPFFFFFTFCFCAQNEKGNFFFTRIKTRERERESLEHWHSNVYVHLTSWVLYI